MKQRFLTCLFGRHNNCTTVLDQKPEVMTATITNQFTSTLLGVNKASIKSPIGVISYNTSTGQVKQCEVFSTFWTTTSTPDILDCAKFLMEKGYGLIRYDSIRYSSLV